MPVEGVCTTRNTPPTHALRARWLICRREVRGSRADPPTPSTPRLPALLCMPQLGQIVCYPAPSAQGHLKRRNRKRIGHNGGLVFAATTQPPLAKIRYLSPLALFADCLYLDISHLSLEFL